MANTPNYGLLKPDRTDNINDVDTSLANNFTTIDLEIKNRKDEIDGHIAGTNGQHTSEVITHADGNVKTTLENHETRLGNAETELTDHEGRLTDIETLGLDLLGPDVENRIATLESDVEGFLAPATFDAMNQQSYTFDEYRIGYVQNALAPINEQLAERSTDLNDRGINVFYASSVSKPKGDGLFDDTSTLQLILDSLPNGATLLIPFGYTFKISSSLLITNKSNIRITGGGTILLTGSNTRAFNPNGTVSNLEIDHLFIQGDGIVASLQQGIGNGSGQNVSYANYHHLIISDVTVGISLNADLAGTYNHAKVYNNQIKNIVGSDAGKGYGIHLANANYAEVYENIVDGSQRHSIYQAKGSHNQIHHNTILNHRNGVADGAPRAAINCARSTNIKIQSNTIIDSYDCQINVTGETDTGFICSDILVEDNRIINPKNAVQSIILGEQRAQTTGFMTRYVTAQRNKIYKDVASGGTAMIVYSGTYFNVLDNEIHIYNYNGEGVQGIQVSHSSFSPDSNSLNHVLVKENRFFIEGTNIANARAIVLDSPVCGNNGIRTTLKDNEFIGLYTDTGKAYIDLYLVATNTNPYLFQASARRMFYGSATPTAGYYVVGDTIINTAPSEIGTAGSKYIVEGWKCVVNGAPGTWRENRVLTGN